MAKSDPTTRFQHYWRVRKFLPERYGEPCKPIIFGRLNSVLVEFADGTRYVTGRYNIRRLPGCENPKQQRTEPAVQKPRECHRRLTDIYWVAGLIEGEGCFPKRYRPELRVSMTDEDVVRLAAQLL